MEITIGVIHTLHGRPELILLNNRERIGGQITAVLVLPCIASDLDGSVRSVLERVVILVHLTTLDGGNLLADGNEGVAEAIKLSKALTLGGLNHQGVADREGEGRSVEAVIDQTLGDINGLDVGAVAKVTEIKDELVTNSATSRTSEHKVVVLAETSSHVVSVEDGALSCATQTVLAEHLDVHPRDGKQAWVAIRSRADSSAYSIGSTAGGSFHATLSNSAVAREIRSKSLSAADRANTWATTTVRHGEGLVKVEVADISTNLSGLDETHLSVHVGTIHVDAATELVHDARSLTEGLLKDTVSGRVGHHDASKVLGVLLSLLLKVLKVDVAASITLDNDGLEASHCSRGRVGAVSRDRQEANVTVVVTITSKEVVTDSKQTTVFTRSTRKRLESAGVKASDVAEHALELRNHLVIALDLILRDERMNVLELRPEDRTHASSRVELHGAAAKRSHALVEAKVLVGKVLDVTHHLALTVVAVESWVSEEGGATTELLGDLSELLSTLSSGGGVHLAAAASASLLEGIKDISNVLVADSLIKREANGAVDGAAGRAALDEAKVDHVVLAGVFNDLLGSLHAGHADNDSVEENTRKNIETSSLEHSSQASSALVDEGGDAVDALGAVEHAVEGSDLAHEGGSSADVGSCTLTTDVLLASAKSHTVCLVAGLVASDTDDTARHDALVPVSSGKEGSVGTTKAHAATEASAGANDDISTEGGRLLEQSKGEKVAVADEETASLVDAVGDGLEVIDSAEGVRVTSDETDEAVEGSGVEGERVDLDDVDAERSSASLDDVNDVPVEGVGDGDGGVASNGARAVLVGDAHAHGLSGGSALVEERAGGDGHASQVADDGLIGEHGLEAALGHLSLVGRVGGVPRGVLQDVASDDGGGDAVVEALTDVGAVLVGCVLLSDCLEL